MARRSEEGHRGQVGTGARPARSCASIRLRGSASEVAACKRVLDRVLRSIPILQGRPVQVGFLPGLRAEKGQLRSGSDRGQEVHAASFIHRREVVLESGLDARPRELARVLVHELFHFVWLRAGNPLRRSYEGLIEAEMTRQAWGELGWSAEFRKHALRIGDRRRRSRRWREYVCESFCDSAAWLLAGLRAHEEFTLTLRHRRARREWFRRLLAREGISI